MAWPKSTIPKFGNWDKNQDVSYSVVFDKARADKERQLRNLQDTSFDQYDKRDLAAGGVTPSPVNVQADFKRVVLSPQEVQQYSSTRENVGANRELIAGRAILPGSHDRQLGMGSRDHGDRVKALSGQPGHAGHPRFGGSMFGEQDRKIQVDPWNVDNARPFIARFRQPVESVPRYETNILKERHPADWTPQANQGRTRSGLRRPKQIPAIPKAGKHVLPKFGDWDPSDILSGEGFTEAFNQARYEKNLKATRKPALIAGSPSRLGGEDLYENSEGYRRGRNQRGFLHVFCCFEPSS